MVKGLTWDPVGKYIASQADDRSLKVWRTLDWQLETSITKPFDEVRRQPRELSPAAPPPRPPCTEEKLAGVHTLWVNAGSGGLSRLSGFSGVSTLAQRVR